MLGIEERQADVATSYPEQGYAGCRPGDCGGCLDVHRRECDVRSACAEAEDGCASCVCESCTAQLVQCQLDAGCSEIWRCLRETRCDLSERAAGNCLEACGTVVQANGGPSGPAWRSAVSIRTCAASAACLSCLAPQVQQSARACNQQNGCQDCEDCFSQCLCSGERFGVCQDLCAEQSAPAECSEANGCADCSTCFDACACNGESFQQCSELCSPSTPVCTSDTSCTDCPDCASQCVCSGGGDAAACQAMCAAPPSDDVCEFQPGAGNGSCAGCTSCLAGCTCNGGELSACMDTCGHHECCDTQSCGAGTATACTCGNTGAECFAAVYGSCDSYSGCDHCACQSCPGELGVCQELSGCKSVFECMRTTECHGSQCFERCNDASSAPGAFAVAEALWACYHGSQCSCSTAPATISCPSVQGSVECAGYQGPRARLDACCTESSTSGGAQTEQVGILGDAPCGLDLKPYYRTSRSCEPRQQPNQPRFEPLETCPDQVVGDEVYNGATLRGCCRAADNTCGYYDDITGLGCLSVSLLGKTPEACP